MSTATSQETRPGPTGYGEDEYIHIVGWFQWFMDRVLRLKIPRSLRGVSQECDPDRPVPGFNAPLCPRCSKLA